MKRVLLFLLLIGCLFGAGCDRSKAESREQDVVPAAVYKANRGLQFSPTATRLFEIKTGEVTSHNVATAKSVPAIPVDALLRTVKGDFVYVVNGSWYLRTPVMAGVTDRDWSEVKEGLYEGDKIVVHGTRALWLAELQAINGGADDDDH